MCHYHCLLPENCAQCCHSTLCSLWPTSPSNGWHATRTLIVRSPIGSCHCRANHYRCCISPDPSMATQIASLFTTRLAWSWQGWGWSWYCDSCVTTQLHYLREASAPHLALLEEQRDRETPKATHQGMGLGHPAKLLTDSPLPSVRHWQPIKEAHLTIRYGSV